MIILNLCVSCRDRILNPRHEDYIGSLAQLPKSGLCDECSAKCAQVLRILVGLRGAGISIQEIDQTIKACG